jgi:hypothetical protein
MNEMAAKSGMAASRTNYEVIWGPGEEQRTLYVDAGDGSLVSATAEQRATRLFLEMIKARVRVGFYIDGVFTTGHNVTAAYWAMEDGKALYSERGANKHTSEGGYPRGKLSDEIDIYGYVINFKTDDYSHDLWDRRN